MSRPLLMDESGVPSVRERFGAALSAAVTMDVAVARIRLATLDLTAAELAGVRRCRLLLGELDASTLLDAAESGAARARLRSFAESGRLEVRSAGLAGWSPDFCVARGPIGVTCMVGAIYFGNPRLLTGPAVTLVAEDEEWAGLLSARFDRLWDRGHDVLPAIQAVLARADGMESEPPA